MGYLGCALVRLLVTVAINRLGWFPTGCFGQSHVLSPSKMWPFFVRGFLVTYLSCFWLFFWLLFDAFRKNMRYSESINPSSAPYLFDQSLHCRQRWVNEDAMVFFAPLLLRFGEMPGLTKVTALNMSGEPMADVPW